MDKSKNKEVNIQLLKVIEIESFLNFDALNSIKDFNVDHMELEIEMNIDVREEVDQVILAMMIKYYYPSENTKVELLILKTSNVFQVVDVKEFFSKYTTNVVDKFGILPNLLSVALGTLRGIIVVRTVGTILENHPLPMLNPVELCRNLEKNQKK